MCVHLYVFILKLLYKYAFWYCEFVDLSYIISTLLCEKIDLIGKFVFDKPPSNLLWSFMILEFHCSNGRMLSTLRLKCTVQTLQCRMWSALTVFCLPKFSTRCIQV
jgi:hypothetical protein